MNSLLRGVGFITGAGSGIGKAAAYSFARHGVQKFALVDINASLAETTARDLSSEFPGVEAIGLGVDVTSETSINNAVTEAADRLGRIDYAVNSAGIGGSHELSASHNVADWMKTIDVDLNGVWLSSRAEIRAMLNQKKLADSPRHNLGIIINVASMYGIVGTSSNVPVVSYTAAKHGVIGLTRADALAYAPKDIRINAICPGYVATPLVSKAMSTGIMDAEIAKVPTGRIAEMDEIADHITFLASPMSSYMYGAALVADGGFTAQ